MVEREEVPRPVEEDVVVVPVVEVRMLEIVRCASGWLEDAIFLDLGCL